MDPVDRAQVAEERHRDDALARRQMYPPRRVNADGNCCDCGFDVEPERLAVDPCAERCIGCQEEHEALQSARLRGRRL